MISLEILAQCVQLLDKSGFAYSQKDVESMELLDFGLGRPLEEGAQILTIVNTSRMAVKLIVLLPRQVEPEHWHIDSGEVMAKQELLRVIYGRLDVYIEGEPEEADLPVPARSLPYYTCRKKVILGPSQQILIDPPNPHWFKAGDEGCVALCVSTTAFDARDLFRNPGIVR